MSGQDNPFDDDEITQVTLDVPSKVGKETMLRISHEMKRQIAEQKARREQGLNTEVPLDKDDNDQLIALVRDQLQGEREDRKHQRAQETRRFFIILTVVIAVVMALAGMTGTYLAINGVGSSSPHQDAAPAFSPSGPSQELQEPELLPTGG